MPTAPKQHRPPGWKPTAERKRTDKDLRADFRGRNRREAKLRIFVRDNARCCECGHGVMLNTSHLDHIKPLVQGGTHDDSNLQTLCLACSKRKTAREQRPPGVVKKYG